MKYKLPDLSMARIVCSVEEGQYITDDVWAYSAEDMLAYAEKATTPLLSEIDRLEKIVSMLEARHAAVPDDYVLVPVEPTKDMGDAFHNRISNACFQQAYKDMLAAAPKQQ